MTAASKSVPAAVAGVMPRSVAHCPGRAGAVSTRSTAGRPALSERDIQTRSEVDPMRPYLPSVARLRALLGPDGADVRESLVALGISLLASLVAGLTLGAI